VQGKGGHESYVERGIDVCPEWKSFEAFYADMGERPHGKTLDRIDNSLGYLKENCRWATPLEQMNNRDINRFIEYKGERKTITEFGRKFGINVNTMRRRLRDGWTVEQTIEQPVARRN
jgi:response regulator of citrate/malate metabolism